MTNNKQTVIIVEDESNISNFMSAILTANGYHVLRAVNGKEALLLISSHCPDVVLLDLGLPDMDGLELIRSVREWSQVPVIVVSARMQEKDKVAALDLGADDYVTKPFGTSELLARIRTACRHARNRDTSNRDIIRSGLFKSGGLSIDYNKRRVAMNGEDVHLTQNEYKIVALLGQYSGRVLTYDFIIKAIWGPNMKGDNQILRVNMANIRRKIEQNPAEPEYIFTEIGVGYRMVEGDESIALPQRD